VQRGEHVKPQDEKQEQHQKTEAESGGSGVSRGKPFTSTGATCALFDFAFV